MNKSIKIDNHDFSNNHPFIVAEVGINHNGDIALAKDCIAAAADAGVDSVKFQSYKTEDFIFDHSLTYTYKSQGKKITESQYDIFKRCELTRDQLGILKQECERYHLNFHSTPTSIDGIKDLQAIGCELLKNGSDYLTHLELIQSMGETGLMTILSTGMATLSEIDQAVQAFKETGNNNLILLHCTSSYPTPPEDINLARLATLTSAFGVNVGFSDHSAGITAAVAATILGTCWIEKHFTLDKNLSGPDHWFSMDPAELKELVGSVRETEKMMGSANIVPTASESLGRKNFRLSCIAKNDLKKGSFIEESDILFRRPGHGIPPRDIEYLLGRRIKASVIAGSIFQHSMLE